MTVDLSRRCARCSQVIGSALEADFCAQCGGAVHHRCREMLDELRSPEQCPVCGVAPRRAVNLELAFETISEQGKVKWTESSESDPPTSLAPLHRPQDIPEPSKEEKLGAARFSCRINRRSLVFGFLLASLFFAVGIAFLGFMLWVWSRGWSTDVFTGLVLGAIGPSLMWVGWVLWRKENRRKRIQVVVHTGGFSFFDGVTRSICLWDQLEAVQFATWHGREVCKFYEVPISTEFTKSSRLSLRRKEGADLVFADDLDGIEMFVAAVQEGLSSRRC